MKSFKALILLTWAAALSCDANGSSTNVTTDGFIKRTTTANDLLAPNYIDPIHQAAVDASHGNNEEFTRNFVNGMWDNNKDYNYIFCRNSNYKWVYTSFDWAQNGYKGFGKKSYNLIIAKSGTFTRSGLGGFPNWAWKGTVGKNQDSHSNVVTFLTPGSADGVTEQGGEYQTPNLG